MLSYSSPAVTTAEAIAYTAARAMSWPAASADQEAALMRAQSWMASAYNTRWTIQFENNDAPELVKFAIIEAAVIEAAQPGALRTAALTESQEKVLTRVEGISWTPREKTDWDSPAKRVPHIEEMLRPIISYRRLVGGAVVV